VDNETIEAYKMTLDKVHVTSMNTSLEDIETEVRARTQLVLTYKTYTVICESQVGGAGGECTYDIDTNA
jgi:hypothetical protein